MSSRARSLAASSMLDALHVLSRWIPVGLVDRDALRRVRRAASRLPYSWSRRFLLECHLLDARPRVDLGLHRWGADASSCPTRSSAPASSPRAAIAARRIAARALALLERAAPKHWPIPSAWIELDLEADRADPLATCGTYLDLAGGAELESAPLDAALRVLGGTSGTPRWGRAAERWLAALPPSVSVLALGRFPARERGALRVCAHAFTTDEIRRTLATLRWSGDRHAVEGALQSIPRRGVSLALILDLAPQLLPRAGLELFFATDAEGRAALHAVLRRWNELGLCSAGESEAIAHVAIPRRARVQTSSRTLRVSRRLDHLKWAILEHGVRGKAYLEYRVAAADEAAIAAAEGKE